MGSSSNGGDSPQNQNDINFDPTSLNIFDELFNNAINNENNLNTNDILLDSLLATNSNQQELVKYEPIELPKCQVKCINGKNIVKIDTKSKESDLNELLNTRKRNQPTQTSIVLPTVSISSVKSPSQIDAPMSPASKRIKINANQNIKAKPIAPKPLQQQQTQQNLINIQIPVQTTQPVITPTATKILISPQKLSNKTTTLILSPNDQNVDQQNSFNVNKDDALAKKQFRMMKNRESACLSRKRKKEV